MATAYAFALCIIFGGMVTFQVLFAPIIFAKLQMPIARKFIREFFPFYYLYFAVLTLIALGLSLAAGQTGDVLMLLLCLAGFIYARQVLMHKANAASDAGRKKAFHFYHRATVLINTVQLGLFAWVIYSLLG